MSGGIGARWLDPSLCSWAPAPRVVAPSVLVSCVGSFRVGVLRWLHRCRYSTLVRRRIIAIREEDSDDANKEDLDGTAFPDEALDAKVAVNGVGVVM